MALIAGLATCRRETLDRHEIAELGFQLETVELKLSGGRQDQYAAALGGTHAFRFGGGAAVSVQPLAVDATAHADLARHAVLVYTGRSHFSSATHDAVWDRFARAEGDVREALDAIAGLPAAAARALEAGDWRALAEVIDENWRQQQRLDPTIATPRTRELEAAMRAAGAWGLKATGAGAGGCLVALGPADARRAIAGAARELGGTILDVEFSPSGVEVTVEWDAPDAR